MQLLDVDQRSRRRRLSFGPGRTKVSLVREDGIPASRNIPIDRLNTSPSMQLQAQHCKTVVIGEPFVNFFYCRLGFDKLKTDPVDCMFDESILRTL